MPVTIRPYEASDLEVCRDLWRDLTQRHRDIYADQTIGGDDAGPYFDEHYLKLPTFRKLFLAEVDGDVVGMCGLLDDGNEAELEPIVVRPAARNHAIGAQLAQRVIDEARKLGRDYINVRPVGRNIEAIAFFQREGFDILGRLELSVRLTPGGSHGPDKTTEIHGLGFKY